MKKILLLPLMFVSLFSFSQTANQIHIVPEPVDVKINNGIFTLSNKSSILVYDDSKKAGEFLKEQLKSLYDLKLSVSKNLSNALPKGAITLTVLKNLKNKNKYELNVRENGISITGSSDTAIFYGIQTLLQLLPTTNQKLQTTNYKISIPQLFITDYPRFPYRGMHLDVGRHFFSPSFIKRYIDYLAYHKLNTFHWHLTEDQGWRIEIKKYPRLTSVGGYRNGTIIGRNPGKGNDSLRYGGFYTQEEIKDIVKYAADRYITIIPEIEMPGHSSAAIAAYPQLSCFPEEPTVPAKGTAWAGPRTGKQVQQAWGVFDDVYCPSEFTFHFLEDVLDEVMQLFPSKYIHIGGDESPITNWKRSAFCQQLMKEKGLKNEHELQSYFIQRIEKYVNSKGKQIIGWDEILEGGLAPNATVMSWRGEKGGITAAKQKHNVVMTPETPMYFNFSQSTHEDSLTYGQYIPVEKVYAYEPIPKGLNDIDAKYILGAQANLWSEYINNPKLAEYQLFPRLSALSEVQWSPKEKRSWENFEKKLPYLFNRYKQWGASYSSAYYELQPSILPSPNYDGVLWKLETKNKNGKIFYSVNEDISSAKEYNSPILITQTQKINSAIIKDGIPVSSITQKFSFNKATGKKITLTNPPGGNWLGSGAFTLVNGVITEKKLTESKEWLGFLGKDLEVVIDLGKQENITNIRLNVLKQENSWIYLPAYVEFFISQDGKNFTSVGKAMPDANGNWKDERTIEQKINASAKYVKVVAKNPGVIAAGKPGAGTSAWIFADEIEVQ
jgi:hexosaminidase